MKLALLSLAFLSVGFLSSPVLDDPMDEVSGYRQWAKANDVPFSPEEKMMLLCRTLTKEESALLKVDPHHKALITVFVNPVGESAMWSGKAFPVGSVIVKEKRSKDGKPIGSTVMIKREKGFNKPCGDWEFATITPDGKKFTSRGKLESCMSCHTRKASSDFTYRNYVIRR